MISKPVLALAIAVFLGGGSAVASALPTTTPPAEVPTSLAPRDVAYHELGHVDKPLGKQAAADRTEGIAGGFVYVPVSPFRTWDSRELGDRTRLPGGFVFDFSVLTDIYDVQHIPIEAVAVTYNLTVTDALGAGFLAVYPADINWPGTSSINWTATGATIANGGTVAIGDFDGIIGGVEILNGLSSPGTHVVLDITGYYI